MAAAFSTQLRWRTVIRKLVVLMPMAFRTVMLHMPMAIPRKIVEAVLSLAVTDRQTASPRLQPMMP